MSEIRAIVYGAGHDHTDPLSQFERLLVWERKPFSDHVSYLNEAGLWITVLEGSKAENAGMNLPIGSIEAIGLAIETYQGKTNHGATEVKVLREWLAVESLRLDRLIWRDVIAEEQKR